MVEITLAVNGTTATLECDPNALPAEIIEERVRLVLPLLELLFEADLAQASLPDSVLEIRFRGIAAQRMMVEAALASATAHAGLLGDIVTGRESIADHGFPEFADS
jgi:hypothetical protein